MTTRRSAAEEFISRATSRAPPLYYDPIRRYRLCSTVITRRADSPRERTTALLLFSERIIPRAQKPAACVCNACLIVRESGFFVKGTRRSWYKEAASRRLIVGICI